MTSWPWMKGIDVAIADPIPPVNEYDERPSVKELIEKKRKIIDLVKADLADEPLYDASKHDDLWILRFVLSHGKKKRAVKAAKVTMAFRQTHKLDDEDFRAFPPAGPRTHPRGKVFKDYLQYCNDDALNFCVPDAKRGVIGFLDVPGIHQHELVKHFPEEEWLPAFLYMSEWSHQWLDYVTRTTGRLTKTLRIANTDGIRVKHINSENQKRDGKAMGIMEDCYPQLLQGIFVCNSPPWIQIPWRIVRPFLPKRVVAKIDFVSPEKNEKERKRFLNYISQENLPVRFGGEKKEWPAIFPVPPLQG